jgi:hypothetical protein
MRKRELFPAADKVDLVGGADDDDASGCARNGFSGLRTAAVVVVDVGESVGVTGEMDITPLYPLGASGVEEEIAGERGTSRTDAANSKPTGRCCCHLLSTSSPSPSPSRLAEDDRVLDWRLRCHHSRENMASR